MTHITETPGAKRVACGLKADHLRRVFRPFVLAHVAGREMVPCPECLAAIVERSET